ncbi:MAG: hypothetical protein K6E41_02235 [Solobacterium sp.]|nr:hypothetical protein [Solobacterium sp.]
MFGGKDKNVADRFEEIFQQGMNQSESEFLDSLNIIVRMVEVNDAYSTGKKLKIYERLTLLANCSPSDRYKYAKKLKRIL